MTEYQQLLQAIEQYYGSGSDQWAEIAKYGIASDQAEQILKQVHGFNIVKNDNGSLRSYNFKAAENAASSAEQAVNSNVPAVIKSFEVPANTAVDTAGKMTFTSGMAQAGNFVFTKVVPAIAAAGVGITLGKTFDKLLYSANPDFWDEHGMSTLNPDVWGDIIGTDSSGTRFLNMILGTTPDNKTQAYIDQNALAYMALYAKNNGVFETGSAKLNSIDDENLSSKLNFPIDVSNTLYWGWDNTDKTDYTFASGQIADNSVIIGGTLIAFTGALNTKYYGESFGEDANYIYNPDNPSQVPTSYDNYRTVVESGEIPGGGYIHNGKEIYVSYKPIKNFPGGIISNVRPVDNNTGLDFTNFNDIQKVAWAALYGDLTVSSATDGIGTQDGAKTPDLSGASTPDEALNKLKEQYPDLWSNAVSQDVVQPDGSTKTYTYVPVAMPEIDKNGNPVSSSSNQAKPQVNPATATEPLLKLITKLIQKDPPVNPPDTGSGDAPVAPPVTGSASSLYAIYNPTLAEINSFGAWLWSDNFIDQIKKLFNDPMQAIIGLHKIYAQPITGGAQNIKVGYLDSGVSSAIVTNQYTTIDCGTVRLSEQFHNVFDYEPFTEVNLYLPFIGIVRLDISDVMRASIHIVYHVDVLSGACLADVKVVRDSSGGTLYQYAGNASVTLPISSGSYMGIVASVAGIAGGIAGTIASGGSALPLIASSASSMFNAHTRVEHSGGFSGNAGAMGGKIPYLIISRPQTAMAKEFNKYIGYPSNFTTTLGSCSGFVKVLECHLKNINATKSELDEIDSILKEGVII